ncbi:MAG: type III secretion system export apparatus subunit SctR [Burkholderiales bacterium]|jgi:type III secretion protein R|nr:type III secretion system export apparatus subunit SctR [Burkholderiales bacterium]
MPLPNVDPVSLLLVMVGLGFLPFAAMVATSYTKIAIVLGLLRNALGVQQVPPNMVLNGVAIIVSCYVMAPIVMEATDRIKFNDPNGNTTMSEQMVKGATAAYEPFRRFLQKHAAEREKAFFQRSALAIWPAERAQKLSKDDFLVLAPAFLLSELTAAFKIGFLIYLAFTVVDLVIANVLLSMGLSQVTPTNVAIPFKLLLFVVLDGWSRLIHGLVLTYQ